MRLDIPRGKYVLAVSGGVDSMVLLDLLAKQAKSQKPKAQSLELIAAHFNHGMRQDSDDDEELVSKIVKKYGVKFEAGRANLGTNTSEETARDARYKFLNEVKKKYRADAVITAHHQDDLIETAIINILRGTGPRGIVSMANNQKILRPLLNISKDEIKKYAELNNIKWREDSSNKDTKYLRNYIRQNLIPKMEEPDKKKLLASINIISKLQGSSRMIIKSLADDIADKECIDRAKFIALPNEVSNELLAHWLRELGVRDFDKSAVSRLTMALKTARPGTKHNVNNDVWLNIKNKSAKFETNR